MQTIDWIVLASYFCVLIGVASWVIRKQKKTAADYFLAGRNLGWWVIGASIFASNIGSEHVVGLAGTGAKDGVALAHYELHAWCLLTLGWVFVPFYMRSKVFTMPEFLERRFSTGARYILSIVSLVTFIVSKIAVGVFAGGIVFSAVLPQLSFHWGTHYVSSFWVGSILVILLTGAYVALGGMRAVAYNDTIQVCVLLLGSSVLTIYGLHKLGGWGELQRVCGSDMFNLWKPLVPKGMHGTWAPVMDLLPDGTNKPGGRIAYYFNGYYPWLGMLFCAPIIGLWYWCTDQYIVQRALGAPTEKVARQGSIFAALLKMFPVFIFILPGMIFFALAKSGTIPAITSLYKAHPSETLQAAFPNMVLYLLPAGLRGLVVAGLMSALMGSLAGVFNACSTLFTMDLYQKWKPKAAQAHLVWIGRVATGVMVLISLAWLPILENDKGGLYNYLQAVQGYLAPPIFVVFFFGVFNKRMNAKGCFWAMVVGFTMGFFRMAIDTPVTLGLAGFAHGYPAGSFLWIMNNVYFQYYSVLITIVSAITMVVVSHATAAPDYARLKGLTFATQTDADRQESRDSWGWGEVATSILVVLIILSVYIKFRG